MRWEAWTMASKTSLLSRTVFLGHIKRFVPLWVLYTAVLTIWLPIGLSLRFQSMERPTAQDLYTVVYMHVSLKSFIFVTAVFAIICAVCLFSYLYKSSSANMMHAFPLRRSTLFVSSYLAGLFMMLVPTAVALLLMFLVCASHQVIWVSLMSQLAIGVLFSSLFFFSLASLCCMISGTIFAAVAFYGICQLAWSAVYTLVMIFVVNFTYGMEQLSTPVLMLGGNVGFLSPLPYLLGHVGLFAQNIDLAGGFNPATIDARTHIEGFQCLTAFFIAGFVVTALAWWIYSKRRIESAGDMVAFPVLKLPVRWLAAFIGGMGSTFVMAALRGVAGSRQDLAVFVGYYALFALICFFVTEMILNKTVRIFTRSRAVEALAMCALSSVLLVGLGLDLAGFSTTIPQTKDVSTLNLQVCDTDYAAQAGLGKDSDRLMQQTIDLHQTIVENRDELKAEVERISSSSDATTVYVRFAYQLKDGRSLTRSYVIPVSEQTVRDPHSAASKLLNIYSDSDFFLNALLGYDHADFEWVGAVFAPSYKGGDSGESISIDKNKAKAMGEKLISYIQSKSWKESALSRIGLTASNASNEYQYFGSLVMNGRYEGTGNTTQRILADTGLLNYTENSHGAWGYSENTKTNDDGSFTTNISLSLDVDSDLMATDFAEVIKASGIKLDANDAAVN